MAKRWEKVGDALSQLANVLLLPNHEDTTANESISGRSHRMGWKTAESLIDLVFGEGHCKAAYEKDLQRAKAIAERNDFNEKS